MAITKSRPVPAYTGTAYPITDHTFDVVVVGAGGADQQRDEGVGHHGEELQPLVMDVVLDDHLHAKAHVDRT